jgi:hypothetical protein
LHVIRAVLALIAVAVVSCSLVVDPGALNEGCPSGTKLCEGECVDITPEVGCGQPGCLACFLPGATPLCSSTGQCVIGACNPNFDNCDNNSSNGCETDKRQSNEHCGMCGRRCVVDNGEPDCAFGVCAILSCNTGFADCDEDARNGCEADLRNDEATCGDCNTTCAAGQNCVSRACQ